MHTFPGLLPWVLISCLKLVWAEAVKEPASPPVSKTSGTVPLPSSFKECSRLNSEASRKLAVDACQQAVQELEENKSREEFAESLLLLAESQERYENPWMALDAVKRIIHETESKKYQERVSLPLGDKSRLCSSECFE